TDKKKIIICTVIACAILSLLLFRTTTQAPVPDNRYILARIDSLTAQNKRLMAFVDSALNRNTKLKAANDSLMKLPPKIKTKYVNVYKQIDRLDHREIKDTLNRLFVENNVDTTRGDTMVYITPSESKYLIKEHYHSLELDTLLKTEQAVNRNLVAQVYNDSLAVAGLQEIKDHDEDIAKAKDAQIRDLQTALKSTGKKLQRQKVLRWLGIAAGIAGTGYMSYLNVIRR
ncbi:MAG: hypothetical protein ACXVNM_14480, partial [Bacteroidia bacterium]